ncbi:MAG: 30S ribosomal protein S1 [Holosporales bacterium]|jgi:small subunit ribosomal protein S1|nr:30S ribosomal protein S1 [Holosporales bacterium]
MYKKNSSPESTSEESFATLFTEMPGIPLQGKIVKGTVIALKRDEAIVDVGLKSEGRVPLKEFSMEGRPPELSIGDIVDVFIERYEDRSGAIVLSREKALREVVWHELEQARAENRCVTGTIFSKVRGGFMVDLKGMAAFLPGSQIDIRPLRDVSTLMNTPLSFHVIKMDSLRGGARNVVVSRRAVLEAMSAEDRAQKIANLQEGQVVSGVVRNTMSYGAFVDIGGLDGLLHNTDISYKRIGHASEVLKIGQTIQVKILKFNPETQRISLGMKQLEEDPWDSLDASFVVGAHVKGIVTNVTEYGLFVEIKENIEGLVYISDLSWRKNVFPAHVAAIGQEIEIVVLDIDKERRRIGLGIKQLTENPWTRITRDFPIGSTLESVVTNVTEFGLFVRVVLEVDGLVHANDLSWEKPGEEALKSYKKGDVVQVKVLEIDEERERIGLGIKQLSSDPREELFSSLEKDMVVTCTITALKTEGISVTLSNGAPGFIKKAELSRDRQERRIDRFAVGEKVDAKILSINKAQRQVSLSIRILELEEEKQAMEEFGSSDSGASLGEILGSVITKANQKKESEEKNGPPSSPTPLQEEEVKKPTKRRKKAAEKGA